ncbi:MAG: hypothetical protein IKI97_14805 [Clostridia bacterium]|nr:hypothetical protein [Clostridia bacterium]
MAKNNVKQYDPKLKEDIASFKASSAFIIFCFIIFLTVSKLQNNGPLYNFRNYLDNNIWLLLIPFGIFAASVALRLVAKTKKRDESYSYFSTRDFLGLSSLFVVYSLTFASTTNIFMYSLVVVGFAVGYYSKHFFTTDFYAITILNLALAFGLWLAFGNMGSLSWESTLATTSKILLAAGVVVTVVLVVIFAFAGMISKKKKATGILNNTLLVYGIDGKKTPYSKLCLAPVFISVVIGIALAGILYFFPQHLTVLVAEIILLVQYVALGVFYTVRLINQ